MPSGSGGSDAGEADQADQTGKSGESGKGKEIVASDDAAQYAGPYLSTPQSVLVRPEDRSAMTGTSALRGQTVCTVKGSGASERLLAEEPKANVEERGSYPQCVTDLMTGKAKAVAGDAVILTGLAHAQARDVGVVAGGISYGNVDYGIAVPRNSKTLAKNVADALDDMRSDGTLDEYMKQLQDDIGWKE
nr:transporter substrate-binding domain-containing protein [Bifidobacterium pongonis]